MLFNSDILQLITIFLLLFVIFFIYKKFKNKFKKTKKDAENELQCVHDFVLNQKDMIKFKFLPQQELSNQFFEVVEITTFFSNGEQSLKYELQDKQGNKIYLRIVYYYNQRYVAISKKYQPLCQLLKNNNVEPLLINMKMVEQLSTKQPQDIDSIKEWINFPLTRANRFRKKLNIFYNDARKFSLDEINKKYYQIRTFNYIDADDQSAIEFELHDNIRQEAYITTYQDISCIQEVFHADKNTSTIY